MARIIDTDFYNMANSVGCKEPTKETNHPWATVDCPMGADTHTLQVKWVELGISS